jgi:hypothetical protein
MLWEYLIPDGGGWRWPGVFERATAITCLSNRWREREKRDNDKAKARTHAAGPVDAVSRENRSNFYRGGRTVSREFRYF